MSGGHDPVPSTLGGRPVQRAEAEASVKRMEPDGLRFHFLTSSSKDSASRAGLAKAGPGAAADAAPCPTAACPWPGALRRPETDSRVGRQGLCMQDTSGPAAEAHSDPGGLAGGSPGPLGMGPDLQGTWEPPSHSQGGPGQTSCHTKCRYLFCISPGPPELRGAL